MLIKSIGYVVSSLLLTLSSSVFAVELNEREIVLENNTGGTIVITYDRIVFPYLDPYSPATSVQHIGLASGESVVIQASGYNDNNSFELADMDISLEDGTLVCRSVNNTYGVNHDHVDVYYSGNDDYVCHSTSSVN